MGRPSKKSGQGASGPDLADMPVGQYVLNYVPKHRELLTAAQVVEAFPPIKGRKPNQLMVGEIVGYINSEGPSHRYWRKRPYKKSPLLDPFWRALCALERTCEPALESLEWRKASHPRDVSEIFGNDPTEAISRVLADAMSELDEQIAQVKTLLSETQSLRATMFPPSYGKKRVRWHQAATALVPLIKGAYHAAGCNRVDFQTPTASGITALQWAIEQLGYQVEPSAIVQFVKRARKLRGSGSGQSGPVSLSGD